MKKATILGLTLNSKLIVAFDDGQNLIETRFEGFQISQDLRLRPYLEELLNKDIECSFNKNEKTIRYLNESLFSKLLQCGVLTVIPKELEDSKVYTPEQKKNFIQTPKSEESQDLSKIGLLLNDKENSSVLKTIIKENAPLNARIECLRDSVLIRIVHDGRIAFSKCKIETCKQYFQLFPQVTYWKSKFLPIETEIKIVSQKYNLLERQTQVFISLSESVLERLLQEGWVSLNQKNYFKNSVQSFKKLSAIENESIKTCKGIYSSKSEILSFIYAKNNYVGVVTNIIEGYIYEITALKTQEVGKVELPMVICPVGDDTWAFDCRQFARKQLIGKEVNVYLHKEGGLNTTGNIVRIEDWKDIESVMLENGFALVREEFKNSILGQKYTAIEQKAKDKKKGLHNKNLGTRRFQDLTLPPVSKAHLNSYVQRRLQVLSRLSQTEQVVIEKIISSLTYKVRVESSNLLLNIRLEGVVEPNLNPNLKQYESIKNEANTFLTRNFYQRTMVASISDYDQQTNSFIGTIYINEKEKVDVQQALIKNNFVYADKHNFISKYNDLEAEARKSNKLIWQPEIRCFEPGYELDKEQFCFEGRFSWIHNGRIAYVQPKDNFKTLQEIQNKLRALKLGVLPHEKQKIGAWCAAPYEGELYRAVIKSKKDHKVTVQFFDWGNQQALSTDKLLNLSEEFLYTQKQCIKVNLHLLAPTKNKEALQKVRQQLFDGGNYVFKKVLGDSVDFFAGEMSSVNEELIAKGLLKADKDDLKRFESKDFIRNVQEDLRKERVGIWEESDSSEDETEEY